MTDKSTSDSVYNETLDKMDDWCEAVLRSILRNLKLDDEETKHSSQTHSICVNASEQRCFQSTEGIWVKSLAQQAAVLNEIQQLLYTQLHLTLRDLFYRQCHIFFCQKESDDIVAYFTRYFQVPRWELYVVSSPRGLVRGQLSFELRGARSGCASAWIQCDTETEIYGVAIPAFPERIGRIELKDSVRFILVVEKETLFSSLGHFVIITSKGFPDIPTRIFISKLLRCTEALAKKRVSYFFVCDMDPWGIAIGLAYAKRQSSGKWFLPQDVFYPDYTLVRCRPKDAVALWKVPPEEIQALTPRHRTMLTTMIQTLGCQLEDRDVHRTLPFSWRQWREACQHMLEDNARFELDAIENIVELLAGYTGCWI